MTKKQLLLSLIMELISVVCLIAAVICFAGKHYDWTVITVLIALVLGLWAERRWRKSKSRWRR